MTVSTSQKVLVLDGHDGAGKSTLARWLAQELGAHYVKPFDASLGELISGLWSRGDYVLADVVSRKAVEFELARHKDGEVLIFDRMWLSLFTVLPEQFHGNWNRPDTILVWADVATTNQRLRERGERVDEQENRHFCALYPRLAERYGIPVLDTSRRTIDESKQDLRKLIAGRY